MEIETTTYRESSVDWGNMSYSVARRALLVALLFVGSAVALVAEPVQSESTRTNDPGVLISQTLEHSQATEQVPTTNRSVSARSAAQTSTGRVLLAADLGNHAGEKNSFSSARALFPLLPAPAPQLRAATASASAAAADEDQAAAVVGRSLRAYTRLEENNKAAAATGSRNRAAFSSAISRAAAAGAMAYPDFSGPVGNSLSSARFMTPPPNDSFDPGFSQAAEVVSVIPGLRLESATLSMGYSSNSLPRNFSGGAGRQFGNGLGPDYDLGASAVLGYSRNGRHSMIRANYTPSHMQRSNIPEWSSTDHRVALSATYDLTPRWTINASGRGANAGQEQSWFVAPELRDVSASSTNLDDLFNQLQAGSITDDEFAAILTGSPVVDDPGGRQNDLDRVLSAGVNFGASYAYSRRITFRFGGSASVYRLLGESARDQSTGFNFLSSSRQTNANMSATYKLSSRTQIVASHVSGVSDSSFQRSMSHSPTVSIRQRLTRNWNYQVGGGVGTIRFLEWSLGDIPSHDSTTWTANGSLNYTKEGHMVSLFSRRAVGDQLGIGSLATMNAGVNWAWQSASSPWGANAGLSFSRSKYDEALRLSRGLESNLYSAGISRRMTPSTSLRSDYFYGLYDSPYAGLVTNTSMHRVQMSLVWRPAEQR